MINFFRKIRYNLMEKSKTGKYFKYAIGEIVLVVIGILLALQINTWNEAHKIKKKSTALLVDYRDDLMRDSLMLSKLITYNESSIKAGQDHIRRMSAPDATFDTVKQIAKYEHNPFILFATSYSKGTFNSMIGTSAFEVLDQNLQRRILDLDLMQKTTLTNEMVDQYFDLTKEFTVDYPFGDNRGSGYLNAISWDIKNERDFVVKYNAMCSFRILLMTNKSHSYKDILLRTKRLITELDLYNADENSKTTVRVK